MAMPDTLKLVEPRHPSRPARPVTARELVGRSPAVSRVQELLKRVATVDGGVLLVAEAGADVESVARELHDRRGAARPFIAIDCGAIEGGDLDRLLFGAVDPAASDVEAVTADGRIAAAIGGTLFLRDIPDIPSAVQAKLARVVRDGEVRLDGKTVGTSLRFVASAVPGIDGEIQAHRFRGDLYRRLATWRIDLPSLRERADDVPMLAVRLLEDVCDQRGIERRAFTEAALALLGALTWPGNLAELAAVIERVAAEATRAVIQIEDLLPALKLDRAPTRFTPMGNLREARLRFERDYIAAVLQHHDWRMADAAQTLGIQRPNLYRKARQLGIPVARLSE
jgi:DNA-binding NtrC family response regulator